MITCGSVPLPAATHHQPQLPDALTHPLHPFVRATHPVRTRSGPHRAVPRGWRKAGRCSVTSPRTVQARSCAAERRETSARARSKSAGAQRHRGASSGAPREAHCQTVAQQRDRGQRGGAVPEPSRGNRSRMASRPAVSWPPGRPSAPRRSCSWIITSLSGRIPWPASTPAGARHPSHSVISAATSWSRRWRPGSPSTRRCGRPARPRDDVRRRGPPCARTGRAPPPGRPAPGRRPAPPTARDQLDHPRWALVHSAMPSTAPISPVPVPATQRSCLASVRCWAAGSGEIHRRGPVQGRSARLASDRMRAAG